MHGSSRGGEISGCQRNGSGLTSVRMKLDILVFASHPDDAELGCGGTILSEVKKGKKVGIVDLTLGELGTRGNPDLRKKETAKSSKVLGIAIRENLQFRDAFFINDESHQLEIVKVIRKYKPDIILANAIQDRHPDHPKAAQLVSQSVFVSGLLKIETEIDTGKQEAWRPSKVYHYIQSWHIKPDFIINISDFWEKKMEAIKCFESQFYSRESAEPETFISSPEFLKLLEARAKEYGSLIGVEFGEGFTVERTPGISALEHLI